jgi:hypothetical protein
MTEQIWRRRGQGEFFKNVYNSQPIHIWTLIPSQKIFILRVESKSDL